jgi:hypothetical protein
MVFPFIEVARQEYHNTGENLRRKIFKQHDQRAETPTCQAPETAWLCAPVPALYEAPRPRLARKLTPVVKGFTSLLMDSLKEETPDENS